jgi:hypothetical protein
VGKVGEGLEVAGESVVGADRVGEEIENQRDKEAEEEDDGELRR